MYKRIDGNLENVAKDNQLTRRMSVVRQMMEYTEK